ncbi:MAG: hypothetical protein KAV87_68255 [Desulfobacteraceae bacterium]|nr:hypothetical protein [Desulfobacteraceae bacterium]
MKRFICMLIGTMVLCLAIISVSGCVAKSEYEALQAEFEALKAENSSLEAINEQSSEEIEVKNAAIQEQQNEIDNTKEELASTKQELDLAETRYRTTLDQLDSYKSEVAMYEEELELYKDTFGSVVQSGGRVPFYRIYLRNNDAAVDPTLAEVRSFMREDITDQNDYITDVYMCGDFANDVHDNAEKAGIRAAWVAILLESDDGSTSYHACNAFKTTDEGLIFIDCTGQQAGERTPPRSDRIVNVRLDSMYKPRFLFAPRWRSGSMGIIRDVEVYW